MFYDKNITQSIYWNITTSQYAMNLPREVNEVSSTELLYRIYQILKAQQGSVPSRLVSFQSVLPVNTFGFQRGREGRLSARIVAHTTYTHASTHTDVYTASQQKIAHLWDSAPSPKGYLIIFYTPKLTREGSIININLQMSQIYNVRVGLFRYMNVILTVFSAKLLRCNLGYAYF